MTAVYLVVQPPWAAAEGHARLGDKGERSVDATGHLSPTAFDFVVPGMARGEVDRRLGRPYISSVSVVAVGRIDLFADELVQLPGNDKPQPTEEVRYYDYRPRQHSSEFARIVFRGERVWYAMLPTQSGARTREEVIAYYGNVFEEQKVHRRRGHILSVDVILWLRKRGLAFVEKPGQGLTHRVVFPAEPRLDSF